KNLGPAAYSLPSQHLSRECIFRLTYPKLHSKMRNMFQRMLTPPASLQSYFLFGPRGTGKTLWVQSFYKNALYLDLLKSGLYNDLLAHPSSLETLIPPEPPEWIILDEIQRVPSLLNEVHRLIEAKGLRFLLTGS